jgi:hypothetical protein
MAGSLLAPAAFAHGEPDQVNDVPTSMGVNCERDGQALFQSFTPSVRLLAAVDLRVEPPFVRPPARVQVVLRVVRGVSPGGDLLGTATAFTTLSTAPYLLHFDFAAPLVLEPPGAYGLELPSSSSVLWLQTEADSYARGSSSACGIPFLTRDFLSQTLAPPDERPPETVLVSGPSGLVNRGNTTVNVRGEDDLTYPAEVGFWCELDGRPHSCSSSTKLLVADGSHRLVIAAIDKAGNTDPTPVTVEWRVDTVPPPTPSVRGPRLTSRRVATYRFVSLAAAGFRCAVDRAALRRCSSPLKVRLSRGRHVLRVQAIDDAGNASAPAIVRIRVR